MRLLTVVLFLGLCATAQAENFTVRATNENTFTPDELAVKPGDSVTFTNGGGSHNVAWTEGTFDDGSQASPPDPAVVWPSDPVRTFQDEGSFAYYCEQHGTPGGAGMAGRVTVSTDPAAVDETPPVLSEVRARVKRRRVSVTFTVSEDARVSAALFRRGSNAVRGPSPGLQARRTRKAQAGEGRLSLGERRFKKGRYILRLTATDDAGNDAEPRRVRFRVR